jgi:hypothetical protein
MRMSAKNFPEASGQLDEPCAAPCGEAKPPAWEMIENGRYRPRRTRGSLLGRELG